MNIKRMWDKPKLFALPVMGVLVVWTIFGHFVYEWLYWAVTSLLFSATFLLICRHLYLSARSVISGVRTIGKPSHPSILGIPKWKFYLVFASVVAVALFLFIEIVTRKMVIYQDGLKDVRSSAAVRLALGDDLHTGWFVQSSMETQGDSGHADMNLSIAGSRGKGRLYITGVEASGRWQIVDLYIIEAGSGARIEIER